LPVVPELFSELKACHVGRGQQLHLVSGRFEDGSDQPFVFPRQAAKQDRDAIAFSRRERTFNRPMELRALAVSLSAFEAPAFLVDPSLNLLLNLLPRFEGKGW
jgi:hypothetical protein